MSADQKRIAVLTGGGDCPGLNAVIRAVVKSAIHTHAIEVVGIEDGFEGLVTRKFRDLTGANVAGILNQGGTILGTSNKINPFAYPVERDGKRGVEDLSSRVVEHFRGAGFDALICIGGDGTLEIARKLIKLGIPLVMVPKTIDNDVRGTDRTFGFDSAVHTATLAIDALHTTADAHRRVMVIEVMGRYAGWIALEAGMAGGGDILLLPEIPFEIENVCRKVNDRHRIEGKRFSIVVVAEGAKPCGGDVVVRKIVADSPDPIRLGGIGNIVGAEIERRTGFETRVTVLGHLQRGGSPTPFDRILATRYGVEAVNLVARQLYEKMVVLKGDEIIAIDIDAALSGPRTIPLDHPLIANARAIGVSFGDR